ncbi:MAG: patatin-like phospholipase family protein [Firmicutes bacterium]|nr:patatin-like phospholipase family protein [Bacillota bacterium]
MGLFRKIEQKKKVGLCLGGGGARGFAHVGALKALREEGLHFDMIAGTSVGSLIAGLFAAGVSPDEMEKIGDRIELKDIRSGLITPGDPLKIGSVVRGIVGDKRIEELNLPLYIVAVDLVEARQVVFDRGLLYEAVSASCAVPVFFRPFIKGKLHLVDGGLLNNIPAETLRMVGADYVVTVDINPTRGGGTEGVGLMDVAKATFSIMAASASQMGLINSDVIIAPDLSAFKSTSKAGYSDMIELGYKAAKEKIGEIKTLLGIKEERKKKK